MLIRKVDELYFLGFLRLDSPRFFYDEEQSLSRLFGDESSG